MFHWHIYANKPCFYAKIAVLTLAFTVFALFATDFTVQTIDYRPIVSDLIVEHQTESRHLV